MELVENAMNPVQEKIGVDLVTLKDLRITFQMVSIQDIFYDERR